MRNGLKLYFWYVKLQCQTHYIFLSNFCCYGAQKSKAYARRMRKYEHYLVGDINLAFFYYFIAKGSIYSFFFVLDFLYKKE